jgi:DNA-binding transcriptional MerR regulator
VDKGPDAFRTISEVADELELPQHVLRFWETRFAQIKPLKRGGGRRFYRPDDVDLLRGIRHLLYGEGYTIRGVQRLLKDEGVRFVQDVWKAGAAQLPEPKEPDPDDDFEDDDEEPGRGLLGLWPALLGGIDPPGSSDNGRVEPSIDAHEGDGPGLAAVAQTQAPSLDRVGMPQPGASATAGKTLPADAVLKLQATLFELSECRRLIDAAASDEG